MPIENKDENKNIKFKKKPAVYERIKRNITLLVMLATVVVHFFCVPIKADEPETENTDAVYLYNIENDILMYEKNAEKVLYPGAAVKMMTGLIACEKLSEKLDTMVTIEASMLGSGGSRLGIAIGETMPLRDLLYGLLIGGYNDCAEALAVYIGGNAGGFIELMNERAKDLDMESTVYMNVTGIHNKEMTTTISDTAKLAQAAASNQLYLEISSTGKYKLSATNLSDEVNIYNANYLVSQYKEPRYYNKKCKGLFSGFTSESGNCLATYASYGELNYICVIMGAQNDENTVYSYVTATLLLDKMYSEFDYHVIINENIPVCSVPVTMSDLIKELPVYPEKSVTVFASSEQINNIKTSYRLNYPSLEAPVKEGDQIGFFTVSYGNQTITVKLVAKENAQRSNFLHIMQTITDFSQGRVFKASVLCAAVLSLLAVLLDYRIRNRFNTRSRYNKKIQKRK